MAPTEPHTDVLTSSCERRNSGLTRPSVSAMQRCSSSAGGSATRSRVAWSTRRYSSSIPSVNAGSSVPCVGMSGFYAEHVLDGARLGEMEALDVVDTDLLENLQHLGALDFLGDGGHLHRPADLRDGLDHAPVDDVGRHVLGEMPVDLEKV